MHGVGKGGGGPGVFREVWALEVFNCFVYFRGKWEGILLLGLILNVHRIFNQFIGFKETSKIKFISKFPSINLLRSLPHMLLKCIVGHFSY